ncbi:MAG: acyltransferase family protein [Muribaculaceae bacterium]|nr:acyltransferase family protein [Muribaculaceae bacterium]
MNNIIENKRNIIWINTGRALSIIGIYIAHCNFYYLNLESAALLFTNLFRISFFYFISGFLFFRSLEKYSRKEKFQKILNKLLWPAIFFPSLIWLPKMIAHGNVIDLESFVVNIFGGIATWFVSSIIVGQLLLLLILYVIKKYIYTLAVSFVLFLLAFYLNNINPDPFPWYYKSGMIGAFFLSLGGGLYKYVNNIEKYISIKSLLISGIACIIMHIYCFNYNIYQNIMSVDYDNILLGLFNNLLGIFFMIQLCHYIPEIKWLQYIGKNSIVFYFFGGGVPLVMGYLVRTYIPFQGYLMTILVPILCLVIVFPINYIIKRYFAWTLDFSKITNLFKR